MNIITVYRNEDPFWDIKLSNDSNQSKTIMGENVINVHFVQSQYINFQPGDYCTVFGEKYILNELPVLKKTGSNEFEYTIKFQSEGFDLSKAQFLFLGSDNTLRESEFPLTANADVFIDLIVQNINRISSGWEKGEVIVTDYKNLNFSRDNCYNALAKVAEAFNTEFSIEGKKIHLVRKSRDTGFNFKVGYNRGLYEITRVNIDSTRIITRLYPYGSTKNIPSGYDGKRLHLPPNPSSGNDCWVLNLTWKIVLGGLAGSTIQLNWTRPPNVAVTSIEIVWGIAGSGLFPNSATFSPDGPGVIGISSFPIDFKLISHGGACEGQETDVLTINGNHSQPIYPLEEVIYIEQNVDLYGVIEDTVIFDEIYPHRTGTVTSIDAGNPLKIIDSSIDFDINSYLQPGLTAKITFMDGQLGGYTFELTSYDNGTKTINFLPNKNDTQLDVPSGLLKAAIGDKYVLTDITMPAEYVEQAEAELLAKAVEYLERYSSPQYTIQAVTDIKFMKNYLRELFIGDTIWIKDEQLEIDRKIRISSVIRNLIEPYSFQITLSDIIAVGKIDGIVSGIASNQTAVNSLGNTVTTRDVFNGLMILAENPGGAGFQNVIIETATNKLFRQQ